jgi:hypothetical protein
VYRKARDLGEQHPGHGVTFATGTPISNTMVEMYTMQRFLDPEGLKSRGIEHFDAWAATFGEVVDTMEIAPDGAGLRPRSRFARFTNLPELQQMFRTSSDVQTAEMLNLPRPRLQRGKPIVVACPMSEEQHAVQQELVERYERLRSQKVDPREDNALAITTDGRKLATDARMLSAGRQGKMESERPAKRTSPSVSVSVSNPCCQDSGVIRVPEFSKMTIADYLKDIEHAATGVFPLVWSEQKRLQELNEQIRRLERVIRHNAHQAQAWQESDDPEDVAFGAGIYWQTYFNEDKERYHKDEERQRLENQLAVRRFSVNSLAGSILQYGKQGISIAFDGPGKCKDGRRIGSQRLADVIWCGRNQSLHWEDHKFKGKTKECFEKLAKEVCDKFGDFEKQNQGLHLLHHLGWTDFEKFSADLISLQ